MLQVVLAKPVTDLEEHRFPAGSMFWFRRSCLLPFQATQLEQQFSVERGQLDATAAHAAERLFALVVEESGKVAMGMEAVEPILLQQKEGLMPKADMKALAEKCAQHEPNPYIIPLANHWRRYPRYFSPHILLTYICLVGLHGRCGMGCSAFFDNADWQTGVSSYITPRKYAPAIANGWRRQ